jgi:hypothetical protein
MAYLLLDIDLDYWDLKVRPGAYPRGERKKGASLG